ncbi:MAG: phage protease [Polyangiaceae bacterium]|nr:phage protease [Polyangiaceae bacterium]
MGDGIEPPKEFRLFVRGWNDTEKGRFLFDDIAARLVMAAFRKWGVDLAIDLEHQMLDDRPQPDPTAKDARGSCRLELRSDGSLWAVGVHWTKDGAARVREKRQRYVSPAFEFNPETMRIEEMINIAITSMPATHDAPALVAAAKRFARRAQKVEWEWTPNW